MKIVSMIRALLVLVCGLILTIHVNAQNGKVFINLSSVDGIEIAPQNIFNYQIINGGTMPLDVTITGTVKYKKSRLRFSYAYNTTLSTGANAFSKDKINNPAWNFSDNALKELFFNYQKLPQGTYEYCVEVSFKKKYAEQAVPEPVNECIFYTVGDIFLIELLDPEDDAKIREQYPMLSWAVNAPFASALTYRLRVAELKKGQNNVNAINRNNPVYQQQNLFSTSKVYPVTAKPLVKYQPYAWTVDAYYKGILVGGAEPWRFTIIEDTLLKRDSTGQSYFEFEKHIAETPLNAPGELKLKYITEKKDDTLTLILLNKAGNEIKLDPQKLPMHLGDNRIDIELFDKVMVSHKGKYILRIINKQEKQYNIPFVYINPIYINEK